ncbi:MAG TPA: ABC transporter substrate-binding protein [Alphaproteobacteria bacterium]|nr:ABC transporter substrate-binding protein [Alphaproteobacteria bacterium]
MKTLYGRWRRGILAALAAIMIAGVIPSPASARKGPPEAVVKAYYAVLVSTLKEAKTLGFDGRYKRLEPAIHETFDNGFIMAVATGFYWRKFDAGQKKKLAGLMLRLSTATYAARFTSYAGEQFTVLGAKKTERGDTIVETQIVKRSGEKVRINYLLRMRGPDWRIIDVHLKGTISELAKWRAEFSSVLRRKGYDGLVSAIETKIGRLRGGA